MPFTRSAAASKSAGENVCVAIDDYRQQIELYRKLRRGKKKFHHPRVNYIVGPFFVRAFDVKLFAEFSGFEIDIVEAGEFSEFVEEVFRPDKERFEQYGAFDNDQRDIVFLSAFT